MNIKERCDITIPKERLEYLKILYYKERRSVPEISKITGYSTSSIYSFMDRHGLVRRSIKERNRMWFEDQISSFTLKQNLSGDEEILRTCLESNAEVNFPNFERKPRLARNRILIRRRAVSGLQPKFGK